LTDDWFSVEEFAGEELANSDEDAEELAAPTPVFTNLAAKIDALNGDASPLEELETAAFEALPTTVVPTPDPATDLAGSATTPLAAALFSIQQNLEQQDLTDLHPLTAAELAAIAVPVPMGERPAAGAETTKPDTRAAAERVTTASTNAPASAAAHTPATQQLTVRLELERLERMNNQLGELSINRNSLSLQNEQLQTALQELQRRFGNFLDLGTQLRGQVNKMMLSPERYAGRVISSSGDALVANGNGNGNNGHGHASNLWLGDFDSLEMDSYSEVYRQLQEAMECILQIDEVVGDVMLFADRSDKELEQQRRNLTALRDELMWARMLPLSNVLDRFPRMLRDLSLRFQKPADLLLSGTGVLVDKAVLDKLADPLTHLIRNAFDHGLESAEERRAAGKPERGQIQIQAYHQGSRTLIEVRDDGRGINLERIRTKAVEMGLLKASEANTISSNRLLDFMFEPGFSTANQVSELSGRGVGLDIVRGQLQSLKGSISVSSEPGQGTTFTLRIPLTLSISKLLLVWTGTSVMALPSDAIEDIGNPEVQEIKRTNGQRFWRWRGQMLPIYSLQELLPYNCPVTEMAADIGRSTVPTPESWGAPLLILRQGSQFVALEVERLLNEQELVIKPFGTTLNAPSYLYGSTILGNGSLVPVIDSLALFTQRQGSSSANGQGTATTTLTTFNTTPLVANQAMPTVLVVDDSTMMRQTLTLSLEKSGYRVFQARDGREALDQLQQQAINLVICDIEMPGMNGFEFLTQRRQQPELMRIPVAMLTSRGGEKHRQLARTLGATAYFTKPYIEQQFLVSVQELLANNTLANVTLASIR
jgi:two-component system, chemotaxis family, sensor histidine kinase and response regulator PixL